MRPAAACISISQLALAAKIVEAEPATDVKEGKGWFSVMGFTFVGGRLEMNFGDDLIVRAELDGNNAVKSSEVTWHTSRITSTFERVN